jgi:hypothetical protein
MRHVIFLPPALAVPAGAFGVGKASTAALLIAPAGVALGFLAGRLRTIRRTIHLTTVAMATNQDLSAAAATQEESTHWVHRLSPSSRENLDREFLLMG